MNFNAEFYQFYFTEKNFSKFALLLTFFQSLDQIKQFFNFNFKQYLPVLAYFANRKHIHSSHFIYLVEFGNLVCHFM